MENVQPRFKSNSTSKSTSRSSKSMGSFRIRMPTPEDIEKYKNKFVSVVDPKLGTISMPDDFYIKCQTTFDKHNFGWIRGPNYKKAVVLYQKTNTGMVLTNTLNVCRTFGIVKPTRVSFSYVPAENQFWMRILPNNRSSGKRVPTAADIEKYRHKFHTQIDPNLETISIPDDFVNEWKTTFDKHNFAWIRGPNYRNVEVFYKQTDSGLVLTDSSVVSKYFGFVRPTRVTLSYVAAENKFWMRILPHKIVPQININDTTVQQPNHDPAKTPAQNVEIDIVPQININDTNVQQPNHDSANPPAQNVQIEQLPVDNNTNMRATHDRDHASEIPPRMNLSNKEGRLSLKRKPLNGDNVIHETSDQVSLRRSKRLIVANNKIQIEKLTNTQPKLSSKRMKHQKFVRASTKAMVSRIIIKKTEFGYEWTKLVTEAAARKYGAKVLHIPNEISKIVLKPKFAKILIEVQMNGVTLLSIPCNVMTAKRYQFERYISKEWSKIIKKTNIEAGDKLMFKLQEPPAKLMIQLIKGK
ncbi:unnamed protein product [Trifolium pratense]|uniref:Uncharacterized protein n=1 Tax=Trifolium pratense TaxID=57577 RepID=A0ACB0L3Q6_TRIPR|nr:unnamed protein product [Trifolium pratense]